MTLAELAPIQEGSAIRNDVPMVYHLGAPHTDNDQLTRSLKKDSELLTKNGILPQRQRRYRKRLNDMLLELSGEMAPASLQEKNFATLTENQNLDRLVFSDSKFLGVSSWMLNKGILFKNAGPKTTALRNLFPDNPCEFFLAIVNPATLIPCAFSAQTSREYDDFIGDTDLNSVCWSDVVSRIQRANPDCPITVWCNEDTPIIWPSVLAKFTGLAADTRFLGELDVIQNLIPENAFLKLKQYLDEKSELNELQRRQVRGIFLEKFGVSDAVEEEIDLPGWTDSLVEKITEMYEDDIERISRMPGVKFICP